jgi:DNA-binding MarR family transcriptional regulator
VTLTDTLESTAFADQLLLTIAAIRRAGRKQSGRPEAFSSLTGAQLELVRLLRRRPGVSVAEAASELRLAPNTVSTLVRELSAAGLLVRTTDSADRRVARLDLAPAMRRTVERWRDRRVDALAAAFERLSATERRRLLAALPCFEHLAGSLEEGVA